jgi:YD repeat-containing protein
MDTTNSVIDYKYDKWNNETMRTITDLNTNSVSSIKTEYTYDKFGNWIKKVTTWSWLESRKTDKREIEYYEN